MVGRVEGGMRVGTRTAAAACVAKGRCWRASGASPLQRRALPCPAGSGSRRGRAAAPAPARCIAQTQCAAPANGPHTIRPRQGAEGRAGSGTRAFWANSLAKIVSAVDGLRVGLGGLVLRGLADAVDEQLDELVAASEITLDPADIAYLEELYRPVENLLSLGFS